MNTSEINAARSILQTISPNSIWGHSIALAIQEDAKIPRLISELKSQYNDNPPIMESIIGADNCKILFK